MNKELLLTTFAEIYPEQGNRPQLYFAPGRVNLIGEHTDYNGGFVLPCAIQYGTWLAIRATDDGRVRLASVNAEGRISVPALQIIKQDIKWFNYPLGVMDQFIKKDIPLGGMELLFSGDIPGNAGLSSSASIEMVTAFALNDMLHSYLEMTELARLSQAAEHEFAGVNCGIMDQFAVALGMKDHALFLNCHTLEYRQIPLNLENYVLIIANTNKERALSESKYNERVVECQLAVTYLSRIVEISSLSELGYPQFFKMQDQIPDEVIRKRARHVISENQRVLNSVNCLWKGDLRQFGYLMNISHDSLKENYEVTGPELDTLVEEARKVQGVLGSRMTGAGFGGCTVNLVKNSSVDAFIGQVGENYAAVTGRKADFYVAEISDGVKKIEN
jgi:galactokinase